MCERNCKFDAIHVVDGVAKIDYDKCKGCKICSKVCPRDAIDPISTVEEKEKFKAVLKAQAEKAKAAAEAAKAAEAANAESAYFKSESSAGRLSFCIFQRNCQKVDKKSRDFPLQFAQDIL